MHMVMFVIVIIEMKRIQDLQEQIYQQALQSGYFRTMQAQLKSYVFDLIETKCKTNKNIDFAFQHPLLSKLRKYPLTSLCLDLVQQFLQSFKFKHTLNVFKKEVNHTSAINRSSLAQSFKIQIANPDSQAVLLSIVSQLSSGNVGALKQSAGQGNNFVQPNPQPIRNNYFMSDNQKQPQNNAKMPQTNQSWRGSNNSSRNQGNSVVSDSENSSLKQSDSNISKKNDISKDQNSQSNNNNNSNSNNNSMNGGSSSINQASNSINLDQSLQAQKQQQRKEQKRKQEQNKKKQQAKKKPEKQKVDQRAQALLGDVFKKSQKIIKKETKQQKEKKQFEAKRAFSEEREKKKVDQKEAGANKIRAPSMTKGSNSMMSKFMSSFQQPKQEAAIQEELDQFQKSKDSTHGNPLFSSSQSGFEKSGFDYSVDSNAIEEYEYVEKAKKFAKKH